MSTQELLNIMAASQIQLRDDKNLMVQQFQNMKNNQEGDKTDQTSPTSESEKKINEKMSNVRLNLFNHVLALFRAKFAFNLVIRYPVFRWDLCKGSM